MDPLRFGSSSFIWRSNLFWSTMCQSDRKPWKLVGDLTALGFKIIVHQVNFFLPHIRNIKLLNLQQLREQGIIVRYFNKPRIDQFLTNYRLAQMNKISVWLIHLKCKFCNLFFGLIVRFQPCVEQIEHGRNLIKTFWYSASASEAMVMPPPAQTDNWSWYFEYHESGYSSVQYHQNWNNPNCHNTHLLMHPLVPLNNLHGTNFGCACNWTIR